MRGSWMTGLSLALVACSAQPDKATTVDSDVDSDEPVDTEVDTHPIDPTLAAVEVEASGVITCANPEQRLLSKWMDIKEGGPRPASPPYLGLIGGGAAVADFDGDGQADVFSPGMDDAHLSMWQSPLVYANELAARMPDIDLSFATGVSTADIDGDGDLDLFVTRWDLPDRLLLNDGTGHFTDITRRSNISGIARSTTSSWGDMDGDGDLDLFVGTYGPHPDDAFVEENFTVGEPSHIWRNLGQGRFEEVTGVLPAELQQAYVFMSTWLDLNADSRPELIVINDFGWARPSRIFWNTEAGLVEDDGSSQFDTYFAGMGLGVGDLNDDEMPDFVQSSWKAASVLMSDGGQPIWYDFALSRNLWPDFALPPVEGDTDPPTDTQRQVFGWGTELVDIDNDGDLDVVMLFGQWDQWPGPRGNRDGLFIQDAFGVFYDEAPAWNFDDPGASRGLVVADLNDDGFLDVYKRRLDARSQLYFSQCDASSWLRVKLRARSHNTRAIGARMRVTAGGKRWMRWLSAGGTSMFTSAPPEFHVGLGDVDTIDKIEIWWPDGELSVLTDVDARQILTVTRSVQAK